MWRRMKYWAKKLWSSTRVAFLKTKEPKKRQGRWSWGTSTASLATPTLITPTAKSWRDLGPTPILTSSPLDNSTCRRINHYEDERAKVREVKLRYLNSFTGDSYPNYSYRQKVERLAADPHFDIWHSSGQFRSLESNHQLQKNGEKK